MLRALAALSRFSKDPLQFTDDLAAEKGRIKSFSIGPRGFHFIFNADDAEHILLTKSSHYQKSRLIFDHIIPITGKFGLVQLEGEAWTTMRGRTNEIFSKLSFTYYPMLIKKYLDKAVGELSEAAENNRPIDLSALFIRYTMSTALAIILGYEDNKKAEAFAKKFIELNHLCGARMLGIANLPLWWKSARNSAIFEYSQILQNEIKLCIKNAWQNPHGLSLVHHLTRLYRQSDTQAQQIITDQIMTFLFAGFETTSASLSFCFWLLARHPQVQERVRKEVVHQPKDIFSLEEIKTYRYTTAVYKEALRLYPPAWIVAREAKENHHLSQKTIRRKDTVIVGIRQIQRSPEEWAHPDSFLPERFLEHHGRKKCAFMPFGVGPRICSGAQLAMLEGVNAISQLTKHFSFHSDDNDLALKALVTLNPQGPVLVKVNRV